MDLQTLRDTPPWEWPEDAGAILLDVLRDGRAAEADRLLAAELAGELTAIDDELARALLSILGSGGESEELRGRAAISLGPVLEHTDTAGFEDPDDAPIDLPDSSESADQYVERMAVGQGIQQALLKLPFEQRQAVLLSDLHGYHYEEIARIAGSSVGTVKSRIHRGRERLRSILSAQPELFGLHGRLEE